MQTFQQVYSSVSHPAFGNENVVLTQEGVGIMEGERPGLEMRDSGLCPIQVAPNALVIVGSKGVGLERFGRLTQDVFQPQSK